MTLASNATGQTRLGTRTRGTGSRRRSLPPARTNANVKRPDVVTVTNSHNRPAHRAGRKEIGTYVFIAHLMDRARCPTSDIGPSPQEVAP
jgi:hypothetical protein